MKVYLSGKAEKQFRNFGKALQIILAKRIRELGGGESLHEEKLSGLKNIYRTRVGDYRIVYRKTAVEIFIVSIGHRREIYRLLKDLL